MQKATFLKYSLLVVAFLASSSTFTVHAQTQDSANECKTFAEIYGNGKNLCQNMWDGAFKYEEDEDNAYVMWFFGDNPNENMTKKLLPHVNDTELGMCHLDYFHVDGPAVPENDEFTECHPWVDSACCHHDTVKSAETLRKSYGAEYEWNRCGPLSPECERFFVHEACFYECEPAVGFYRKYPEHAGVGVDGRAPFDPACDPYSEDFDESKDCEHNSWQVEQMPIKASYCDAWFTACKHDLFCGSNSGSFFECARIYELEAQEDNNSDEGLSRAALIGVIVGGVLLGLLVVFVIVLVVRERQGQSVFAPLEPHLEG